jgi:hypothetical protein
MKNYSVAFLICLLVGQCALAAEEKIIKSNDTITAGQEWAGVSVWDTPPAHTTVSMTGGTVYSLSAYNTSLVQISGGSLSSVNVLDTATVTMSGSASASTTTAGMSGVVNMNGGTITHMNAIQQSLVNLRGGSLTYDLSASDLSVVNVFGLGLAKTSSGGPFGFGRITGQWQDNSSFAINLANPGTYAHINLVTVPEPVALLLFGAGLPLLRRFRRPI